MSDIKIVNIDGKKYSLVTASAEDQQKIMHYFKKYALDEQVLQMAVVSKGIAQAAAYSKFHKNAPQEIIDFVESKTVFAVAHESGEKLTADDFHCNWSLHEKLILEALSANFQDFFDWIGLLGDQHRESITSQKNQSSESIS